MIETAKPKPSIIERAFEIARSGAYFELRGVRIQLKREGYDLVDRHLDGTLAKQLRQLCKERYNRTIEVVPLA